MRQIAKELIKNFSQLNFLCTYRKGTRKREVIKTDGTVIIFPQHRFGRCLTKFKEYFIISRCQHLECGNFRSNSTILFLIKPVNDNKHKFDTVARLCIFNPSDYSYEQLFKAQKRYDIV